MSLRPNEERNIYFPIIGESGFIQMATIMNAENRILINEEVVLKDRSYKLQKQRHFFLLTGKGRNPTVGYPIRRNPIRGNPIRRNPICRNPIRRNPIRRISYRRIYWSQQSECQIPYKL